MLATRIVSAIVIAAILVAGLVYLPPLGWCVFSLVWFGAAAWEWGGFAKLGFAGRVAATAVTATICAGLAAWTGLFEGSPLDGRSGIVYLLAAGFWLLIAPLWLARNPQRPAAWLVLLCGVFAIVPAFLAVLELRHVGIVVFLLVAAIVWVADIAAYFAGKAFGRRKLAPSISPGKTWEGAAGGLAAVGLYALAAGDGFWSGLGRAADPAPLFGLAVGALALGAWSIVGDLFESALKRQAGLKDSGRILPGHGGMLDRIDALLPVLPLAALAVVSWLKP